MDWYETVAGLGAGGQLWQVFSVRRMASGGAFHCGYPQATQQAFLEAHKKAFAHFGGVFRRPRPDLFPRTKSYRIVRGTPPK